jgi:hypothetical protein
MFIDVALVFRALSSETQVNIYLITRRHIRRDNDFRSYRRGNLSSHKITMYRTELFCHRTNGAAWVVHNYKTNTTSEESIRSPDSVTHALTDTICKLVLLTESGFTLAEPLEEEQLMLKHRCQKLETKTTQTERRVTIPEQTATGTREVSATRTHCTAHTVRLLVANCFMFQLTVTSTLLLFASPFVHPSLFSSSRAFFNGFLWLTSPIHPHFLVTIDCQTTRRATPLYKTIFIKKYCILLTFSRVKRTWERWEMHTKF